MRAAWRALPLGVIFLASAAAAPSSLTLFGRIDQNLTRQQPGNKASVNGVSSDNAKAVVQVSDGSGYCGRSPLFGVRGSEDLYVGLGAKSFGEMRLGRIETLSREITYPSA
jgi:predicted porin